MPNDLMALPKARLIRWRVALAIVVGILIGVVSLPQKTKAQAAASVSLVSGTVGSTVNQTLRLSVTNVGLQDVSVRASLISNPLPSVLREESFALQAGESRDIDLPAASITRDHFDSTGRIQIRAVVRSNAQSVLANLEVFNNETARTGVIIPLRGLASSSAP